MAPRWSPAAACITSSTRRPARSSPTTRWRHPPTSTRRSASARAALPGWATATPAERSAVLAKLAHLAGEHADDLVAEEVSQTGKPVRLAAEFDVPGSIDNIDFFAGAARHLEGKATAEYSGDHTSSIRREAVGVVGDHHAVELPAADGGVESVARVGRWLHGRDQTVRADSVDDADAGPAGQRGRAARRRVQRRDRAPAPTSAPRWPGIGTSTW